MTSATLRPLSRLPARLVSRLAALGLAILLAACGSSAAEGDAAKGNQGPGPVILAASSMQGSLDEVATAWVAQGHAKPVIAYASSAALARQLVMGSPADIFLSADVDWMDAVEKDGMARPETRRDLLGNRLALIVPASNQRDVPNLDASALDGLLGEDGRLALADPASVPAGKYARAALEKLGLWAGVADRVARAENVRAAMALVERGEAPAGIVFLTDGLASQGVRVVQVLPETAHGPIIYPVAQLTASSHPEAAAFLAFLQGAQAGAIFKRHGFELLVP